MDWLWLVTCSLCNTRSGPYRFHGYARVRAVLHATWHHPFGHAVIGAVDSQTYSINHPADKEA